MQKEFDIPHLEKGLYEHYKGNVYRVIGVGRHTESDDYYVVYSPVKKHEAVPEIWLRPYAMFTEMVTKDGKTFPRFKKIEEA